MRGKSGKQESFDRSFGENNEAVASKCLIMATGLKFYIQLKGTAIGMKKNMLCISKRMYIIRAG